MESIALESASQRVGELAGLARSHSSDKNKNVARVGHPNGVQDWMLSYVRIHSGRPEAMAARTACVSSSRVA